MNRRVYIITALFMAKLPRSAYTSKPFMHLRFIVPLRTLSDFEAGIQADVHIVIAQAVNSSQLFL